MRKKKRLTFWERFSSERRQEREQELQRSARRDVLVNDLLRALDEIKEIEARKWETVRDIVGLLGGG